MISAAASGLFAQGPDFTGKWTVDKDKMATIQPASSQWHIWRNQPGNHDGRQDHDSLISTGGRAGAVKNVYKLDGSESQNFSSVAGPGGGGSANAVISTAKWDGAALVIAVKLYNATATLEAYSLDGGSLRLDFVNPQSGSGTPKTAFYKKAS